MLWGISPNAPAKEQIKSEFEGIIRGLNCVGEIDYLTYSKLFDEIMPLFDQIYEQGKKDALKDAFGWHKFPEETPPEGVQILVTWKGENNSFEVTLGFWKFDKFTGGTFSHPYDWVATPIAWAELPDPYKEKT